jgi:voltage-gated potassium channel
MVGRNLAQSTKSRSTGPLAVRTADALRRQRTLYYGMVDNPFLRLRLALLLVIALAAVGTAGFVGIEHYSWLDALYMTVITLSTVGFDEVRPLDTGGKLFTMGLIIVGLATATWALSTVAEVFVSEKAIRLRERRHMDKLIDNLTGHIIVCGFGRIGRQIAVEYHQHRIPFVVVDPSTERMEALRSDGILFLAGDASADDVLVKAGIHRAAGLVAVTPTDAVNTFIVLTARGVRPDLFIVSRADNPQNVQKLYRAGASKVVAQHVLAGRWIGVTSVNPAVTDFISAMTEMDHSQTQLRELTIDAASEAAGKKFAEVRLRERTGALVVAVRSDGRSRFTANPPDDYCFKPSDVLVAIGSPHQLRALGKIVDPDHPLAPLAVGALEG